MDSSIIKALKKACEHEGLSQETCSAIEDLFERQVSNVLEQSDLNSKLDDIYYLINKDLDEN